MPRDGGSVLYDGRTIEETSISYVFQELSRGIVPWRRAIDNIRYPMDRHGYSKKERESRIEQLIEDFGIRIDLNAYPYMLSGGQQQAVSILRALAIEPDVLFLDEPFSALDYEMTLLMREKLQTIFEKTKTTMILVSHDLEEAVQMADKVLFALETSDSGGGLSRQPAASTAGRWHINGARICRLAQRVFENFPKRSAGQ